MPPDTQKADQQQMGLSQPLAKLQFQRVGGSADFFFFLRIFGGFGLPNCIRGIGKNESPKKNPFSTRSRVAGAPRHV